MLPTRWSDLSMTSPFDRLLRFRREIDHMLDRAYANDWRNDLHPEGERVWSFPMELVETPEEYRYAFEVPGFTREDLDVTVENGVLTVSAERRTPEEGNADGGERHRYVERRFGRFVRSLRLPANTIVDDVEAVCENGLLTVTIPKSQEGRPRRIVIGSGGGARRIAKESAA